MIEAERRRPVSTGPAYTDDLSFRIPYEHLMNKSESVISRADERMILSAISAAKIAYEHEHLEKGSTPRELASYLAASPTLVFSTCKSLEKKGAIKGEGELGLSTRRFQLNEKGINEYFDSEYKITQELENEEPLKISEILQGLGEIFSKLETS